MTRQPVVLAPTVRLDADAVLRIAADANRTFSEQADVIAYAYHQLARQLAQMVGPVDANWFCFASWTSKAIGQSLNLGPASPFWGNLARRLRVPAPLRSGFRRVMIVLLGGSYLKGLSLANRSIFLEMGTFAADLWTPEPRDGYKVTPHDPPAQAFVSSLLDDADPEFLDTARRLFAEARATVDPTLRSELILGANLALSAFEQARAQKVLEFVLYRPIRWLFRVWWRVVLHWLTPWRPFHRFALYAEPHGQQPRLVQKVEDWWARRYTRRILALETPIGEVAVGAELSPPGGFQASAVPPPFRNPEVRRLFARFAGGPMAGACAPAGNWLSYDQRMHFIACYFRLYQHVHRLFDQPFEAERARCLEEQLDDGPLPQPARVGRGPNGGWTRFFPLPRLVDPEARALDAVRLEDNVAERRLGDELAGS
jgi:hypothetical protein